MRTRMAQIQRLLLYHLERGFDVIQRSPQAGLDLVELLRYQRQPTEQVIQIFIDLPHALRYLADLQSIGQLAS